MVSIPETDSVAGLIGLAVIVGRRVAAAAISAVTITPVIGGAAATGVVIVIIGRGAAATGVVIVIIGRGTAATSAVAARMALDRKLLVRSFAGGTVIDASSGNGKVVHRSLSSWWANNFICGWRIFG